MNKTPSLKQRNQSWGQILKQEIANPTRSGSRIQFLLDSLVGRVKALATSWGGRHPRLDEAAEDAARMVLCLLLEKYKEKQISQGVTKKTVFHVLNTARQELKRAYKEEMRQREHITESQLESSPIFNQFFFTPEAEPRVELIEGLFSAGVIDETEYYFILCQLVGLTYEEAGELVGLSFSTVRDYTKAAISKIRDHLADIHSRIDSQEALEPWQPQPKTTRPSRGRPRMKLDPSVLSAALKHVIDLG
jgi:DNA-directed RNA polymerase specialized sigma24 family protein